MSFLKLAVRWDRESLCTARPLILQATHTNVTGFHTNDAESENSRLKGKNRKRYGQLNLNENELAEYVFYINVGSTMTKVLEGLAVCSGDVVKNTLLD